MTGEPNPTFPAQDGAEIGDTCDFWTCYRDNYHRAEPLSIHVYRTGAWCSANGMTILDNVEDLGPVEGFLAFHGPEIFPS